VKSRASAWLIAALLITGVAAGLIFASRHPDHTATIVGGIVALPALALAVGQILTMRRDPSLDEVADNLATAVEQRWREEAKDRRIAAPSTIHISWQRGSRDQSHVSAIADINKAPALPEVAHRRALDDDLLKELDTLYRESDSGKIVIVGMPGAGKTGILIQMLLQALKYRKELPGPLRSSAPVPIFLTLSDWLPNTKKDGHNDVKHLIDWASRAIRDDFTPVFTAAGHSLYRTLLEQGRIALFLDGLEEMPEEHWKSLAEAVTACRHLRIALTARPRAARQARVLDSDRIRLEPVDPEEAGDYLARACKNDLHPELWRNLADFMRANEDSVAAQVLSTPLMLSLALDSYDRGGADPTDLSESRKFADRRSMESFLLEQIIPLAYGSPHVERRGLHADDARNYLSTIARKMDESRDLRWWRVRRWCPWLPPTCIAFVFLIAFGAGMGCLSHASVGLAIGLPSAFVAALVAGGTARSGMRRGTDEISGWRPRLVVALAIGGLFGTCLGLIHKVEVGAIGSGIGTVALGCVLGAFGGGILGVLALHDGPLTARPKKITLRDLAFGMPTGVATGAAFALVLSSSVAVPVALIAGTGFSLGAAWSRPLDRPGEGATPYGSFRRDLEGGLLMGLVIGLTATALITIVVSERHDLLTSLLIAVPLSFAFSVLLAAAASQSGALVLVTLYLRLTSSFGAESNTGDSYPHALLWIKGVEGSRALEPGQCAAGFLEDARSRLILRSAGTHYQFRHARLQDLLRGIPWSDESEELEAYMHWDDLAMKP
jgi:hypothetical protein